MDQNMQGFMALLVLIGAMWIVLIGFAVVMNRRDWAAAIARWPFITALRLVRWALGESILAIGRAIRGRPPQRRDRRQGDRH